MQKRRKRLHMYLEQILCVTFALFIKSTVSVSDIVLIWSAYLFGVARWFSVLVIIHAYNLSTNRTHVYFVIYNKFIRISAAFLVFIPNFDRRHVNSRCDSCNLFGLMESKLQKRFTSVLMTLFILALNTFAIGDIIHI